MIRPFTLLCFCAFAGAGAWLYQVKHAVALKDEALLEIRREIEQDRQRLDILRAEWALLNEPDRLRQTATRMLELQPMQPQNFLRMGRLDQRLPAAVAFAGAPDIFAPPPGSEPAAAPTMVAAAPATEPAPAAAAAPAAAEHPPASQAVAPPHEAPAQRALAAAVAAQRAEQARRAAAQPAPPRPAPAPVRAVAAAAPLPPPHPVRAAAAPSAPASQPVTRVVARVAPPQTTVASALGSASALGRPILAPPVPVASAAAGTLR